MRVYPVTLITVFALLSIGAASQADGQTLKGTLLGTVTDSSGAVVPGARVTLTDTEKAISRTSSTNASGNYVFANLDPGPYRVEIEQTDFKKVVRDRIQVQVNTTVRVDMILEPGAVSEIIEVTAAAPILKTDRADTGGTIVKKQLQDMPLGFNRNYQGLVSLVPGASRSFRPHSQFYNSQDSLSTRVNGQSRQANNVQLEGIDNNIDDGNLSALVPPIEALEVVDVSTSNYDPELGRAGGAVINATIRSGTNNFHGSLFYFHKNDNTDARNVLAADKAETVFNQFGGTFGGPIKRGKTFFFGDYQGTRDRRGQTNLHTIPTPEFRQGDLRQSNTTIYDPATGNPDGTGRQPFPNNVIPENRISPISRTILNNIPAPNRPGLGTNLDQNSTLSKDIDQFDIKVDHRFTDNDLFFARYSFSRNEVTDPPLFGIYGGPRNGGFAGNGLARTQSPGVNYTHIFGPNLLTEVRLGVLRNRNDAVNADKGLTTSRDIGIPGANVDEHSSGISEIRIDGFSNPVVGFSASMPWERAVTTFDLVNNWNWIRGNHALKFGFDIRRSRNDLLQTQTFNPRGRFVFSAGPTALNGDPNTSFANSFASFLLDQPTLLGRDLVGTFPTRRILENFFYAQDKWQVTPKLTLDLGLRYEYVPFETPRSDGGTVQFDPTTNTLLVCGIGNNPKDCGIDDQFTSFAPRIGLAYRLSSKTVVRGGYGISYLPRRAGGGGGGNSGLFNFPIKQANSFNAPNSFSAAGALATGFPEPLRFEIPENGIIPNAPNDVFEVVPEDLHHGYVQSWNFSIQRQLPRNFVVQASYVGNHGVNVDAKVDINASQVPGTGVQGQPLFQQFGRTAATNMVIGQHTNYNALQIRLDHPFSDGFLLTTSYSFSRATDLCSDRCSLFFDFNGDLNRGRSDEDRTHVFTQSYVYELPFGPGKRWLTGSGVAGWIARDWQANGILTYQSGDPLNFTFSSASLNAPGNGNRPNLVGSGEPEIFNNTGPGELFFDTSRFEAPQPETIGNVGRNILEGPNLFNLDFSVFRRIAVQENWTLEFRAESLNLSNTPAFNRPNTTFGSSTFGQVTTAQESQRSLQFGLKLIF